MLEDCLRLGLCFKGGVVFINLGLISFFTGTFPTDINRNSAWLLGTTSGISYKSVFKNRP